MPRRWLFTLIGAILAPFAANRVAAIPEPDRREIQRHGYLFERWVRERFFDGYEPLAYTQKWDIPAKANSRHGGIPVNTKAIEFGSPIDLGDALRQFDIASEGERFLLIVGFWEQAGPTQKRFVNLQAVEVTPAVYRRLWHPVTRADLERLDAVIKDKSLTIEEARRQAQHLKTQAPFRDATIGLNPKIDARQRRLQCSLRFAEFFRHLAPGADRSRTTTPKLFGVALPGEWASPPRPATKAKPAAR